MKVKIKLLHAEQQKAPLIVLLRKNTVNGENILKRTEQNYFLCLELQEVGPCRKGELADFRLGSLS